MSDDIEMTPLSPSEHLERRLRALDLEPGRFFLGGSAPLALRDVRQVGDIDIGVTTAYWFELLRTRGYHVETPEEQNPTGCDPPYLVTEVDGIEAHFFFTWRKREADETRFNDYNLVMVNGLEMVKGWPCILLTILMRQKADRGRLKDYRDVATMARIIEEECS